MASSLSSQADLTRTGIAAVFEWMEELKSKKTPRWRTFLGILADDFTPAISGGNFNVVNMPMLLPKSLFVDQCISR